MTGRFTFLLRWCIFRSSLCSLILGYHMPTLDPIISPLMCLGSWQSAHPGSFLQRPNKNLRVGRISHRHLLLEQLIDNGMTSRYLFLCLHWCQTTAPRLVGYLVWTFSQDFKGWNIRLCCGIFVTKKHPGAWRFPSGNMSFNSRVNWSWTLKSQLLKKKLILYLHYF